MHADTPTQPADGCRYKVAGGRCRDFGGRKKNGDPCDGPVIGGTTRCRMHTGKKGAVAKAQGAVVLELRKWGLGDAHVDPGETLLRLVSQSAQRVDLYSRALGEAYDAADRLRQAHEAHKLIVDVDEDEPSASELKAAADLDRIFNTGGIAALVGQTYTATQAGGIYATGEAIRGLAQLEAQERDRLANFCAKAIAAGLAERQVQIAERMGLQMAAVLRAVLGELVLTPDQWARVPLAMETHVAPIAGPRVIDGRVA
jgi:hypothetical protein